MKILDTIQHAENDLRNLAREASHIAQAIGEGFRMLEQMLIERQRTYNTTMVKMTWGSGKDAMIFGRTVMVPPGGSRTLTFCNERRTMTGGELVVYSSFACIRITAVQLGNMLMPVEGHVTNYTFHEPFPIGARIAVALENLILEEK